MGEILKKPRILWVSSDPKIIYSFSQQSEVICEELAKRGYDVHYLADGYKGCPYLHKGFKVYPIPIVAQGNHFGNYSIFQEYLKRIKPDLMISLTNTYQLGFLVKEHPEFTKTIPWIHWTPYESETPFYSLIKYEKNIPYFVTVSQKTRALIAPYQKNIAACIGHAVNPDDFYPLDKKTKLKIRRKYGIPDGAFVVGTISTCALRKQPLRLFDAFVKFAGKKKDAYLVWYGNFDAYQRNPQRFADVRYLFENFYQKYKNKIKLIHSDIPWPAKKVNELYNLFDVFALATAGEGFGIPLVEAMFCQVPPIATAYTSIPEIIRPGCGWQVKVKDLVWGLIGPLEIQGALVDIEDFASKLELAYKNKKLRLAYGQKGYQRARALYNVGEITNQWESLINKVFLESKKKYPHLWQNKQPSSVKPPESFEEITKWLVFAYLKQEKWSRVIKITEATADPALLNARGYAFNKLKQYSLAKKCFERILELDPANKTVRQSYQDVVAKTEKEMSDIFSFIYQKDIWQAGSGTGSKPENTIAYRDFLEKFLKSKNIKTIVDLGCGDWQFSKYVNWREAEYLGVDVVKSVIDADKKLYEKANIKFMLLDFYKEREKLPAADLLLIKDVLQHWPTEYIKEFLPIFNKFKQVIVTNCIKPDKYVNAEIKVGGFRPLDLTKEPFNLKLQKLLSYYYYDNPLTKEGKNTKAVFLYEKK